MPLIWVDGALLQVTTFTPEAQLLIVIIAHALRAYVCKNSKQFISWRFPGIVGI